MRWLWFWPTVLAAVMVVVAGGCGDSMLVNRVADQAAAIARLEIELQASEQARDIAVSQLAEAKAELAEIKQACDLAKQSAAKAQAEHKEAEDESDALRAQLGERLRELTNAESQLKAIRTKEAERLDVIGRWRHKIALEGGAQTTELVFNDDGTGVFRYHIHGTNITVREPQTCQFHYMRLDTAGEYGLVPTRPEFSAGSFTIDPDGKSAYLQHWDELLLTGRNGFEKRGARELVRIHDDESK